MNKLGNNIRLWCQKKFVGLKIMITLKYFWIILSLCFLIFYEDRKFSEYNKHILTQIHKSSYLYKNSWYESYFCENLLMAYSEVLSCCLLEIESDDNRLSIGIVAELPYIAVKSVCILRWNTDKNHFSAVLTTC